MVHGVLLLLSFVYIGFGSEAYPDGGKKRASLSLGAILGSTISLLGPSAYDAV
jgi:hypothetical protein